MVIFRNLQTEVRRLKHLTRLASVRGAEREMSMFSAYRCLLYLYPEPHRNEFGDEMLAVFHEARAETSQKGLLVRAAFYARELGGLLIGAFNERVRSITASHSWELFRQGDSPCVPNSVSLDLRLY